MDGGNVKETNIEYLLKYCSGVPDLYNEVSRILWAEFNIRGAEVALLCTFVADKIRKEERKNGKEKDS